MRKVSVHIICIMTVVFFGSIGMSCGSLAGAAIIGVSQSSQNKKISRVVQHGIDEIEKVLPGNATVWIQKGRESASTQVSSLGIPTSTSGVADTAVDDITSALIQKGVRLVDRQNTALIRAEQTLQAGGNVSDQELLSVGKEAGANTLVTISVVPQGSKQRLQIRVVDIEKGVPIMQSGSGDEWQI